MNASNKLSRWTRIIAATLVGTLTITTAANAVQTVLTPNAAFVPYSLAAGSISGAIVPPASQSVLVMGVCNTLGFRGVGHVSLLRVPGSFLEWVGLNSPAAASITSGFSGSPGTFICQLDFSGGVAIEVNTTDSFRIHNKTTAARDGNVTLIW